MRVIWALLLTGLACRAAPIPESQRFPAGADLTARVLHVEGTRVRYVELGRGPPVVLVHGIGASMYAWRAVIAPLAAANFRVIAFDNRGFGFSSRPRSGYANQDYVSLLAGLLDSLGVAQAALVGHSMGGQIAAEFALAHPDRVRGLALLAPAGFGIRLPWLLHVARWPLIGPLAAGLRGRWITGRILRATYADPSLVSERDVDQYYASVADQDFGRALRGVLREYRFDALEPRAAELRAATLLLWGREDRFIPVALGQRFATQLERAAFVTLPGLGHALAEENPAVVVPVLVRFLTDGLPRVPENLALHAPHQARASTDLFGHTKINHLVDGVSVAPQAE